MSASDDGNPISQDDSKPGAEDPNAPINIKVVDSRGDEVFFKIKRSTKLSKLQGAYASKVGKDVNSIRFLYEGNRINDDDTPSSLDMEEGEVGGSTQRQRV
ncbi:ubiquitin-like protein [Flagelloscypha sp. PMI_526]|nr:ubiquitin-like protein [Flagelloscypha sp. PMI_526]